MRRRTFVLLAFVLVFALILTACAARRPLQTPIQPRQDITGQYDNNKGIGTGVGYGVTGAGGNYGGAGATSPYNGGVNGLYGGGATGTGNPMYSTGYGGDYRNIGGSNNSRNFGYNLGGMAEAERVERACESLAGVNDATCVISGNTAYVAIDTAGDLMGRNVAYGGTNDLASIKSACAQKVKAANPQVQTVYVSTDASFLERLRRLRNGGTTNGLTNELNDLIRGLTPVR